MSIEACLLEVLAGRLGAAAEESFLLLEPSGWRDRTLKSPLLVSAASESSEAVIAALLGEFPMGRQGTGKPPSDTSCDGSSFGLYKSAYQHID